jgi:hypothetical protein
VINIAFLSSEYINFKFSIQSIQFKPSTHATIINLGF